MISPFWFGLVMVGLSLLALPYFGLIGLTGLAAMFRRSKPETASDPTSRFLIVIPAHDEETGIAETVRSCRAMDYPSDLFEVLVIADNCTDETASIARREGATVLERNDPSKKSKGYALEYLFDRLHESGELETLSAVVIIDADSTASNGLLREFDRLLKTGFDWLQCRYTVTNPEDSWRTRLMTYAFSLINGVSLLGHVRLGLSASLRGNGMCFSTSGLRRVPWRNYGLVEDMEYSWAVRAAGEKIGFAPDVSVQSQMLAGGGKAAVSQRRRWEAGRVELKKRMFWPLLRSNRLNGREKLASLIDLTMPSMATLAAVYLGLVLLNVGTVLALRDSHDSIAISAVLILISGIMTLALALYAVSPFVVFRLPLSYIYSLAYFPLFAVWKLFIGLGGRPQQWVRTAREQPTRR